MDIKIMQAAVPTEVKDIYLGVRFAACMLIGSLNKQSAETGRVLQRDVQDLDLYNMVLIEMKEQILKKDSYENICENI